jgi:hypothetical protein
MKLKFIYVLLLSAFALIVLQSRSGGAAANNLGDRTGSPLSGAAGCSCHVSGNPFSPVLSITVKDASQVPVTTYIPGQNYTIEFNVTSGMGNPAGYGLQAVAISPNGGNLQAGTMASTISSNTQITALNGRSYIEHAGVNAGGTFLVNWTAPASGFGNISIYGRGIAVNGSSTAGDEQTSSVLLNLTEVVPTSIAYGQSNYCADDLDPTPTITGTSGGSFTAMPTGLTINSTSGAIDLSASVAQAYTVSYNDGTGVTTSMVTVDSLDDAQFTYTVNTACESSPITLTPTPATSGGTWSSTTGLSINANSGLITPNSSTVGSYMITHTTNGTCPTSETFSFSIVAQDVAAFSFTDTTICIGAGSNPVLTVTGNSSGFYTASPAGLTFANILTGEIDVNNSSLGTFAVTYISNGTCPITASTNVTVSVCSGVETITEENSYELFPNPNNGVFSIKSNNQAGMVDINIVDILGKVVYTERNFLVQNGIKTVALETLTAGTYFVQVQQENKQQTFKVIIE